MSDTPRATVREINGQLVLDDPDALAIITVFAKHNCDKTLEANMLRVEYFKERAKVLGSNPKDVVITIINVDDRHGGPLADMLMPGYDWQ